MTINIIEIILSISIISTTCLLLYIYKNYKVSPCVQEINDIYTEIKAIASLSIRLQEEADTRITNLDKAYSERNKYKFDELFTNLSISELTTKGIGNSIIENLELYGYDKIAKLPQSNLTSLPSIGSHRAMLISHRIDYLKRKTNDKILNDNNYNIKNEYDLNLIFNAINFIEINHNWKSDAQNVYNKNENLKKEINTLSRFNFIKYLFCNKQEFNEKNIVSLHKILIIHDWSSICRNNDAQRRDFASRTASYDDIKIQKIFSNRKSEIIDAINKKFNSQLQHGSLAEETAKKIEQTNFYPTLKAGINLRPYQVFGAKFAIQAKKSLLGDEMGLGKTLQAISIATHIKSQKNKVLAIAVIPASLSENWKREVEKFTHLSVYNLKGANIPYQLSEFTRVGGLAIISYEATWQRLIDAFDFNLFLDLLIIDEAHYIKNKSTNRTLACIKLMSISEHVLLMTGTPIENNINEMIHIIDHINENIFNNISADTIEKITPTEFSRIVSPVYLRRKTSDVLKELPEKTITEEWVELSINDENAYINSVLNKSYHDMRRSVTLGDNSLSAPSAKAKRAHELIAEYSTLKRKIIVFSYYLDVIDYLQNTLNTPFILSGKIPIEKRQHIIDNFSSSTTEHILVAQITSTGIGLNIQAASVVLIIEPQFKPSIENQAIARCYRMGQKNHVNVHRFFATNTVEEKIYNILCQKSDQMKLFSNESRLKDVSKQATQFAEDETSFARKIIDEEYKKYADKEVVKSF